MSAPPTIDTATLNKIRELLHLGKKVDYIANRLQIPRPHIIEAGFGDRLRYRAVDDTMTAAPAALDLADDADIKTITEAAEFPHPKQIPARLLPPQPRTEPAANPSTPELKPQPEPGALTASDGNIQPQPRRIRNDNAVRAARYQQRIHQLGVSVATIRAWARDQNMPVPAAGYLPGNILDAYDTHTRNVATGLPVTAEAPARAPLAPAGQGKPAQPHLTDDIRATARHVGFFVERLTAIQQHLDAIRAELSDAENDACQLLLGIIERTNP